MKYLTSILIFVSLAAFAQNSTPAFELSCRAKAKEVAADTYKTCVTQGRQAEVERVRQEYQEKIKAMKAQYEQDLKKAAGQNRTAVVTPTKTKEFKTSNDDSTMDIPEPMPIENSTTF